MSQTDYLPYVLVVLIKGTTGNCNHMEQTCKYIEDSDPPRYSKLNIQGPFQSCELRQVNEANQITWQLNIFNLGASCFGFYSLKRNPSSELPLGEYCLRDTQGQFDCNTAKAIVMEMT